MWLETQVLTKVFTKLLNNLKKAGYVLEENATESDILTYRIEKRPLKRPTWESVDANVTIDGQEKLSAKSQYQ